MKKNLTINELARMTQDEFSNVGETLSELKEGQQRLEAGQQRILDVLLEIPSKKSIERLENKVNIMDAELASVQRKISK